MLYTTGYPTRMTVSGAYNIFKNNEQIYSGYAYPFPGQSSTSVNISDIVRDFVSLPDYELFMTNLYAGKSARVTKAIDTFTFTRAGSSGQSFSFIWDYTGQRQNYNDNQVISDSVTNFTYYNGLAIFTVFSTSAKTYTIAFFDGANYKTIDSFAGIAGLNTFGVNLSHASLGLGPCSSGAVVLRYGTNNLSSITVKANNEVHRHMILYWVGLNGSMKFINCTGTNTTTLNTDRSTYQIENENIIDYRGSFGVTNYRTDTYNTYTLNTPILTDSESERFIEFYKTPMAWLYDYNKETISAVNIVDTSVEEKNRAKNKIYNYTIKCKDSQTYSVIR